MLADFTHQDSSQDYIVTQWEYVDLSPLGTVDSVEFIFTSSDVGQWGINTPTYVAIDNFNSNQVSNPNSIETFNGNTFAFYPNPAKNHIFVTVKNASHYTITDLTGKVITTGSIIKSERVNTENLANGVYLITISNKVTNTSTTKKFVVEK